MTEEEFREVLGQEQLFLPIVSRRRNPRGRKDFLILSFPEVNLEKKIMLSTQNRKSFISLRINIGLNFFLKEIVR